MGFLEEVMAKLRPWGEGTTGYKEKIRWQRDWYESRLGGGVEGLFEEHRCCETLH